MKKEGKFQTTLIIMLAVAVVAMSVGFATFTQSLSINGNATFNKAQWDVRFDTASFDHLGTVTGDTHTITNTTFTYNLTLAYGESHTMTFNVKNYGTIDATLKSIVFSGDLSYGDTTIGHTPAVINASSYAGEGGITYKVYVDGTEYTTDNSSITGHDLAVDGTHLVKIELMYNQVASTDTTGSSLKLKDNTAQGSLTITLGYQQKVAPSE